MKGSKYVAMPMTYARSTMSYCIALICPQARPDLTHQPRTLAAPLHPPQHAHLPTAPVQEPAIRALGLAPEGCSMKELCAHPGVAEAVLRDVQDACKKANLAKFEVPTRVVLIDELWTPDNDMLTAVNKLKRKPIEQKHLADIDATYV